MYPIPESRTVPRRGGGVVAPAAGPVHALPELLFFADSIGAVLRAGEETLGAALEAGEHPGDLSTVTIMGATSDHIVETSRSLGLDLALPLAAQAHYRRAIENGHGSDNWTRVVDSIREPR